MKTLGIDWGGEDREPAYGGLKQTSSVELRRSFVYHRPTAGRLQKMELWREIARKTEKRLASRAYL